METTLAGRYQIIKHLGGGGFGQTFLANDLHLPGHPLCVVKQLKPSVSDPAHLETAQRLFNQEAETLYRLGSHNQIPRLLAHFEQNQEFYLAQEYIDGIPLNREIVPGQQLSEAYTIALLQDILQVLAFVHQQHVIHRDIKPANLIRRSSDCKIVLIDFGAVKQVRDRAIGDLGPTSITVAIGSPGYMPTEQQAFKPHFSSDVYAVGMVALEALTGLRPKDFPRDSETGEISCVLMRDRISISPELEAFLDRMVRYDYRQRYRDAFEALQALQQILEGREKDVPAVLLDVPTVPYLATDSRSQQFSTLPPTMNRDSSPSQRQINPLPVELQKSLEQLLMTLIGPIAPVVVNRTLEQVLDASEVIEQLATYVPELQRSRFREQAGRIMQTRKPDAPVSSSATQGATIVPPMTQQPASMIDPAFIQRCELELAKSIGPIASVIVKRTLTQQPHLSQTQLVEVLATNLTANPKQMAAFRQDLLPSP